MIAFFIAHLVVVLPLGGDLVLERLLIKRCNDLLLVRAQVRRHVVQLVITHGEVWLDASHPCENLVSVLLALLDRLGILVLLASQVVALLGRALGNFEMLRRQVRLAQRVH